MKTSVGGGAVPAAQSGQVILLASLLALGVVGWEHLFHSYILGVHDESLAGHLLHWLRDSALALPLALLAVVGGTWIAGRLALRSAAGGLLGRAVLVSLVFGLLMVPSAGLHDLIDDALVGGESNATSEGYGHSHANVGSLEGAGGVAALALHGARDGLVGQAAVLPLATLGFLLLTLVGGDRLARERWTAAEVKDAALWPGRDGLFVRQVSRREVLRYSGAGAAALALGASGLWALPGRSRVASSEDLFESPFVAPFSRDLRIPPVMKPVPLELRPTEFKDAAIDYFEITQRVVEGVPILPGLGTTIWAYTTPYTSEGEYHLTPGPTFRLTKGDQVVVRQINELHGNNLGLRGVTHVETATHMHGGNTVADSDGHALDRISPDGKSDDPDCPDPLPKSKDHRYLGTAPPESPMGVRPLQPAATLWYHDHAMFHTGRNVYMGLAGFFLITDEKEKELQRARHLPAGPEDDPFRYDVPLVIQDRLFNPNDGSLVYPVPDERLGPGEKHNVLRQGVFGDVILVNGVPVPRFEVEPRVYRFRLLNGSNARVYLLALDTGDPIIVIGTDDGFLCNPSNPNGSLSPNKPKPTTELLMSTSERYDVLIDFRGLEGRSVVLENLRRRELGDPIDEEKTRLVMRFDVNRPKSSVPDVLLEEMLRTNLPVPDDPPPPRVSEAVDVNPKTGSTRDWRFERKGGQWVMNGEVFPHICKFGEGPFSASPKLGEVEIWRFINNSGGWLHPIHPHLVKYWILERNGEPPRPYERGPKDSVTLGPNDVLRVLMRFMDWTGPYVFHCHNIEHEDNDMMTQFECVLPGPP